MRLIYSICSKRPLSAWCCSTQNKTFSSPCCQFQQEGTATKHTAFLLSSNTKWECSPLPHNITHVGSSIAMFAYSSSTFSQHGPWRHDKRLSLERELLKYNIWKTTMFYNCTKHLFTSVFNLFLMQEMSELFGAMPTAKKRKHLDIREALVHY